MTRFNVNTSYFMHSDPEWNKKNAAHISKYNHGYYETHKEKWADNKKKKDDETEEEKDEEKKEDEETKKETDKTETKSSEKEKKDSKKSGGSGSSKKKPFVPNGGSKAIGKGSSKKSSNKSSKEKKSDEEKEEEKRSKEEEKKKKEEEQKKRAAEILKKREEAKRLRAIRDEERKKRQIEREQERKKAEKLRVIKLRRVRNNYTQMVRGKKSSGSLTLNHTAVYVGINSQPYFEHHGRLGMKWGKRNGPPYPLDYSKLSAEEREKDKARVREEGDIESVSYKKNRSYFSDQEINEVINRYQLNQRINQLAADSAKMKAGKSKTQELVDNMQKVADVGNKLSNAIDAGSKVYNNVAKIMNAFGDADLPIIGQAKAEKKKEFKATKKELDKMIEDLENGMGEMTNQEMQDALKRKTMFDSLTKDRDAKRAAEQTAKQEEANAKTEKAQEEYSKFNSGIYRKASDFVKDNFNEVEHVTGEVVDSGIDWTKRTFLLEDKQRR